MSGRFAEAFRKVRRGDFEVEGLLPAVEIRQACEAAGYVDHGSVYTAVTTVLMFLRQVLAADRSCQQAVSGLTAQRMVSGDEPASPDTGGYCKARKRLPEAPFWELQRHTGWAPEAEVPEDWKWCGRNVRVVDGSTLKIQDTAANRAEYPTMAGLTVGTTYPVVRILVLFSLAVGTVLEAALRPYQGKNTGETGMLRDLAPRLSAGDVLLGDRYFAGYWDISWWQQRGVDLVTRRPESRRSDFRRGRRLGPDDHLVTWTKTVRPDWLSSEEAAAVPRTLTLREVRVRVEVRGFRTQVVHVLTTLLDPRDYPAAKLAELYRRRWQAELNLRSLKTHMQMEHLRTKHPETVRKEFAMHLIAYNSVRRLTFESALGRRSCAPWELSFKGSLQLLNEFLPRLHQAESADVWLEHLLLAASRIVVGDRPNRIEPYAVKLRPKDYPLLRIPRSEYKRRLLGKR